MFNLDLDSTGHVYMTDPEQQEAEIDCMARYDSVRERFAEPDQMWDDSPTAEEIEETMNHIMAQGEREAEAKAFLSDPDFNDVPF